MAWEAASASFSNMLMETSCKSTRKSRCDCCESAISFWAVISFPVGAILSLVAKALVKKVRSEKTGSIAKMIWGESTVRMARAELLIPPDIV